MSRYDFPVGDHGAGTLRFESACQRLSHRPEPDSNMTHVSRKERIRLPSAEPPFGVGASHMRAEKRLHADANRQRAPMTPKRKEPPPRSALLQRKIEPSGPRLSPEDFLVRRLGFRALLIHGDTLVMDRWNWLRSRLPPTANEERLVDIGCGNGGFTIGAALRGYASTGLTWDSADQQKAQRRSRLCAADRADFEVLDVRRLGERVDFAEAFDVAVCTENIEHIIDDFKLMRDIAHVLKPGGRLLLTTPNAFYRPISEGDKGLYALKWGF